MYSKNEKEMSKESWKRNISFLVVNGGFYMGNGISTLYQTVKRSVVAWANLSSYIDLAAFVDLPFPEEPFVAVEQLLRQLFEPLVGTVQD
jgi:hypothetical protein